MADFTSEYVNTKSGERQTAYWIEEYEHNVYITGSCIAYGDRVDDSNTIASALQHRLNGSPSTKYRIHNCGAIMASIQNIYRQLQFMDMKKGDIVCIVDSFYLSIGKDRDFRGETSIKLQQNYRNNSLRSGFDILNGYQADFQIENKVTLPNKIVVGKQEVFLWGIRHNVPIYDLSYMYNRPHQYCEIYSDIFHISYMGYAFIAQTIFKAITHIGQYDVKKYEEIYDAAMEQAMINRELKDYIQNLTKLSKNFPQNAGAIVMNCNPFTNGHKYLIEKALEYCSCLYVLVVEEDKSFFKFKDRIQMVKDGVADLENDTVLSR